jgi:hypothetical protein
MALQQIVPVSILLRGDGASGTFVFQLGDLYQISSGSAVPYGNLGTIPSSIEVSNPPVPIFSATIDANGNITITLVSALGAGVVVNLVLNLIFDSGDMGLFPRPIEVTGGFHFEDALGNDLAIIAGMLPVALADGSGAPITSTGGSLNTNITNFPATVAVTQSTTPWVVTGSVIASGTVVVSNLPASQVVTLASTTISNFPASQAVTGTFWQATQPVSGTVVVNNFPAIQPVSGTISVANFPATVAVTQSTSPWVVSGTIAVSNFPASQAVTGTFWQATQPVSGTFWQAIQPVSGTITANQGTSPWVVSLASTTITGTVAVTQSTSPWVIAGTLPNNAWVPGTNNVGVLPALANAVAPTWTEGAQVLLSEDLKGGLRINQRTPQTPAAPAQVNVGTSSVQVVAANANRTGLVLTNLSTNRTISLGLAATAVASSGIVLPPGASWVMDAFTFVTGAINAVASGNAATLAIQELS